MFFYDSGIITSFNYEYYELYVHISVQSGGRRLPPFVVFFFLRDLTKKAIICPSPLPYILLLATRLNHRSRNGEMLTIFRQCTNGSIKNEGISATRDLWFQVRTLKISIISSIEIDEWLF